MGVGLVAKVMGSKNADHWERGVLGIISEGGLWKKNVRKGWGINQFIKHAVWVRHSVAYWAYKTKTGSLGCIGV